MADFEVSITPRSGLAAVRALTASLEQLARKQRILEHLAQSRRARLSSNIDDRRIASQARIQRRLAARRPDAFAAPAQGLEPARLAEAQAKPPAPGGQQTLPEAESPADPAFPQEWREFRARLARLNAADAPFPGLAPAAPAAQRGARSLNIAPTVRGSEQNEIARLQARAYAETQRADQVVSLLEHVLSASTASIIKHQARLEAMQAQINALQGR